MDRFWDAWDKSTVVSGAISLGLSGAVVYLSVAGLFIPDVLSFGFGAVIGFFFGSKGRDDVKRAVEAVRVEKEG